MEESGLGASAGTIALREELSADRPSGLKAIARSGLEAIAYLVRKGIAHLNHKPSIEKFLCGNTVPLFAIGKGEDTRRK